MTREDVHVEREPVAPYHVTDDVRDWFAYAEAYRMPAPEREEC